jgi:hypothetical protein
MARRTTDRLPDLRDTGRQYVEGTQRARLRSPGVERYVRARARGPALAVAGVALTVALVAAMLLLR